MYKSLGTSLFKWKILYLPAIDEQGQALWPEYFSIEKLVQIKRQMGSALFAAMYMGRPEALSGEVFKPGWLKKARLMAGKNERGEDDFGVLIDGEFLSMDEFLEFPNGRHDNQVDALSGATAIAQTYYPSYPSEFYLWEAEL